MPSSSQTSPVTLRTQIESLLLPDVKQPAQYIGGELGSIVKDHAKLRGRFCFAFPDLYTIGMSHYGLQLLYSLMNRHDGWCCERVFVPDRDMEEVLRRESLPLYSLETFTPLNDFDVIGFTLQYELAATGVLTILDLGRIPIHSKDRVLTAPLVIAGGPVAATPEPFAPFVDAFVIGDGEESLPQVCDAWIEIRDGAASREDALLKLARRFPFVYVPSLYDVTISETTGRAQTPKPKHGGIPEIIRPAQVTNLEQFLPDALRIVPNIEVVQDRVAVEVMRGCPGRCHFCQSSAMKRPIRTLAPETIVRCIVEGCDATGIQEVSLLSLSTSDYPKFSDLLTLLQTSLEGKGIVISVPSLRVNQLLQTVMTRLTTERSSAFTLAPEAARMEMRQRIGKPITDENLFAGCRSAFENGFNRVKMYFMVGLPEETPEDVDAILTLASQVAHIGKEVSGRFPTVTINVSNLVPKPHTQFERLAMASPESLTTAHRHLKHSNRFRTTSVKYHDVATSRLEAFISRGDRRVANVIERAWQLGARLDAWSDHFRPELWQQAIAESGLAIETIVHEPIGDAEELAWGHIRW
ncbi:MAG: TIGR03960 family B12-binding radical SAM protein [Thermoguttaceae bacterium]